MNPSVKDFFAQEVPVYDPSDETLFVYLDDEPIPIPDSPISVKVDISDRGNPSQIGTDNISIAGYVPEAYDPETGYYLTTRTAPGAVYVLDRGADAVISELSTVVSTDVFNAQTVNQRYAIVYRDSDTISMIDMDSDAVVDEVTGVSIDSLSVSNETAVAVSDFIDVLYYDLSGGTISLMHSETYSDIETGKKVISDGRYHYVTNYDGSLQKQIENHKLTKWDSQNPTKAPYNGREVQGTAVAVDPVNRDTFATTLIEGSGYPYGTVYAEDGSVKGTQAGESFEAVLPMILVDSNGYKIRSSDLQHMTLTEYSGEPISEGDTIDEDEISGYVDGEYVYGYTVSKIEDGYIHIEEDSEDNPFAADNPYESLAAHFDG